MRYDVIQFPVPTGALDQGRFRCFAVRAIETEHEGWAGAYQHGYNTMEWIPPHSRSLFIGSEVPSGI
jgi:hypothetical protein